MSNTKELSKQFEYMVEHYLENSNRIQNKTSIYNSAPELEIRFGTNPKQAKHISKVDYLQVVHLLYANGWKPLDNNPAGKQFLRIIPEEIIVNKQYQSPIIENEDSNKGEVQDVDIDENKNDDEESDMVGGGQAKRQTRTKIRSSKIRAEIFDTYWIQRYCGHNDLVKLKEEMLQKVKESNIKTQYKQIKFTEKTGVKQDDTNYFQKIQFTDFNFNVSYQIEKDYSLYSKDTRIQTIYNNWTIGKKIFRSINRVRFQHPDIPMFVDISIVKTNRKYQKNKQDKYSTRPLPKETIQQADIFNTNPIYEIEIELNNDVMGKYQNNLKALMKQIRHTIRLILSGLQGTPYPVSYDTQDQVLDEYMTIIHGDSWLETKRPRLYFVGPNSVALQIENISKTKDNLESVENIQSNYCVTEKADGERCVMVISKDGKIYLISRTLKVLFTGSCTKVKSCFGSIVDGEFIYFGKNNRKLFQFSAFDIYFIGGRNEERSVRHYPFISHDDTVLETRYNMLKEFHEKLVIESVTPGAKCEFRFRVKDFIHIDPSDRSYSIFQASREIWNRNKTYEYEIDGLIFTPMSYGVGGNHTKKMSDLGYNTTWNCSFKWKPPKYNSIDFLVVTEKDKQNRDLVRSFVKGDYVVQYKTLYLMVGFDTKQSDFMNPFDELIYDKLPCADGSVKNHEHYQVKPFIPSTPYNPESYICYMPLIDDGKGKQMKTSEGEYFDENMIVEFRYDLTKTGSHHWKWTPMRIRHDKTQSLLEGKKSMNVFKNANDVWKTIHYPITERMITGMEDLVDSSEVVEVYYNATDKNELKTRYMRDFHNLYVKSKLIIGVAEYLKSQPNSKDVLLIDYAVGKGGDLSKWIRSKLKFVMGIDYSNDNIHNASNGACVRFLQHRCHHRKDKIRALFVEGNSKLNIRNKSDAIVKPFEKDLVQYVFGQKNIRNSDKLAFDYGIAKDGFHISSCQFAIHYFFENHSTLHHFLQNLAECTRLNGYFVGTCFDGMSVFTLLQKLNHDTSYSITVDGKMLFEIERKYNISIAEFPSDETSIGLPVNVYLESIGQHIIEYLVHFDYFVRLMEDYGFQLVERNEATYLGFGEATGKFDQLYRTMEREQKKNDNDSIYVRDALKMSKEEKQISFLYRYFIFKKVRQLSPETIQDIKKTALANVSESEDQNKNEENKEEQERKTDKIINRKVKNKKIVL